MSDPESVDFLQPHEELAKPLLSPPQGAGTDPGRKPPRKRRLSVRTKLIIFGLAILATGGFLLSTGIGQTTPSEDTDLSFLGSLKRLVVSGDKPIAGQDDDRVNFLLLGIGGAGHEGSQLTDTILFGSFKPSTKEVGLISIPRDLSVNIPGYGSRKINSVNAYAEQDKLGSGPAASAAVVGNILNQPVHYTLKVDFKGFEDIINAVGGVDVYVDRTFTDKEYPILGMEDANCGTVASTDDPSAPAVPSFACRYEVLTFNEGWTHMDGATALKYARSRHGNNGEGTDFARAARQQKILLAVKDKALSLGVLLNPVKLNRILGTIQDNVDTNMTLWEMVRFAKYIPDIKTENIAMHVLDNRSGLLYEDYINGAYVLLPYETDWSELRTVATNIFEKSPDDPQVTAADPTTNPALNVSVEIQNGTATTGLASQTAQLLQSSGVNVTTVGNATDRNLPKTIIYDLTDGQKDEELAALKDYLSADVYMSTKGYLASDAVVPDEVLATTPGLDLVTSPTPVDFLIILGQDSTNLVLR